VVFALLRRAASYACGTTVRQAVLVKVRRQYAGGRQEVQPCCALPSVRHVTTDKGSGIPFKCRPVAVPAIIASVHMR